MKNPNDVNEGDVLLFLHCRKCSDSKPKNKSMKEYSRISVGRTTDGLLVWCDRHEQAVAHFPYDWSILDQNKLCECGHCNTV
jgi:hypothetical protein